MKRRAAKAGGRNGVLPIPPPDTRALRIYARDPLLTGVDGNIVTVQVPYEALKPGPVGNRVEVIDYDPELRRYYSPIDLDDRHVLAQDGITPSESDPRFHQQMVYAVTMDCLRRFGYALGRRVGWRLGPKRPLLRIYPHGAQEANAYFDPGIGAVVFGYFRASTESAGANLPGGYVFTCLSHDICAHEVTHAILHGLRDKFSVPTNPDVPAFHEAFADLVAILGRFSLPRFVEEAIAKTEGDLEGVTPLVELGRQFGEAIGRRGALRDAIGKTADPSALDRVYEPHERGSILVAAVFDAYLTVYQRRTRDLLRLATGGTGIVPKGELAPDLVGRLAKEARRTAEHFLTIIIRAIDYCPPVDIEFGEFLRAMITADKDLVPDDPWGYRAALIDAFRQRGIYPTGVFSLSEESLLWNGPRSKPDTKGIKFDSIRFDRAPQEAHEPDGGSWYYVLFHKFVDRPRNRRLFGLDGKTPVQVHSVQPLRRIGPDGRIRNEVVVEAVQKIDATGGVKGMPPQLGGATLVVNEDGLVRYSIHKRLGNKERQARQRAYLDGLLHARAANAYGEPELDLSLRHIHCGGLA